MKDYQVLTSYKLEELCKKVSDFMNGSNNPILHGGIYTFDFMGNCIFCQSVSCDIDKFNM